jgi:hypothetical protein
MHLGTKAARHSLPLTRAASRPRRQRVNPLEWRNPLAHPSMGPPDRAPEIDGGTGRRLLVLDVEPFVGMLKVARTPGRNQTAAPSPP